MTNTVLTQLLALYTAVKDQLGAKKTETIILVVVGYLVVSKFLG